LRENITHTFIFCSLFLYKPLTMQVILVLHNLIRWAVLLFGLWTLFSAMSGVISKRNYTAADGRSNFFFMLSCDIQLLLGLILYYTNSWFDRLKDLGNNMKDANNRFFTMEHSLLMIIALILVHVGRVSVKKAVTPAAKHKRTLLFFGLAIVLILAAIPWPFREAIARPLFRWFN
jgi:hypothetical protein